MLRLFTVKPPNDPIFEALYHASLHALGYRVDGIDLIHDPPLYLSPVNGYQFPKPRRFYKLDRPRPPDKAPLHWLLEGIDAR